MTQGYSTDYRTGLELTGLGREVAISDGTLTYTYDLHDGDTLADAMDEFCDTYDSGPDPITIWITATEYRDGEEIDCIQRKVTFPVSD